MATKEHTPAWCDVPGCGLEAWYWYEDEKMQNDTFYLCEACQEKLAPSGEYIVLDNGNGHEERRELAVYACSEECPVCSC